MSTLAWRCHGTALLQHFITDSQRGSVSRDFKTDLWGIRQIEGMAETDGKDCILEAFEKSRAANGLLKRVWRD